MTKKMTISPEVIWDNKTIKWTEKVETISPEYIELPTYDYGNWQNTLDAELALRNSSWWVPTLARVTLPKTTSTWSYNLTSSSIWFTPRFIRVQAEMDLWIIAGMSDCSSDWTTTWWVRAEANTVWNDTFFNDTASIIYVNWNDWTAYRLNATFTSFISGWIQINITVNNAISDVKLTITAYQ